MRFSARLSLVSVVAVAASLLSTPPSTAHMPTPVQTATSVQAPASVLAFGSVAAIPATMAARPGQVVVRNLIHYVFELQVIAYTNFFRRRHGCAPVRIDFYLRRAARIHSAVMANRNTMSHQLRGESRLGRRISQAGYRGWNRVAENIATGFNSPYAVVVAWMRSPSHRRNLLDCSVRHIGVGVIKRGYTTWWTQDFGRR